KRQPQSSARGRRGGRLRQTVNTNDIVVEIGLYDKCEVNCARLRRRYDANVGIIAHAVECAEAISFVGQIEWLTGLQRKRRYFLGRPLSRVINHLYLEHLLPFDLRVLGGSLRRE